MDSAGIVRAGAGDGGERAGVQKAKAGGHFLRQNNGLILVAASKAAFRLARESSVQTLKRYAAITALWEEAQLATQTTQFAVRDETYRR
jgi:hypothetical protein